MLVNKDKFEQALAYEQQQPYFPQFAIRYSQDQLSLPGLAARLAALPAEFDVRELLFPGSPDQRLAPEWPKRTLLVAKLALAAAADNWVPEPRHVAGDWLVTTGRGTRTPTYVLGDLTVTGNLRNYGRLIVLGNVTVGGAWNDEPDITEYGEAIIAGSLTVGRSLLTEGMLAVGGHLQAPYLFLDYNQGYTTVLGGCRARLLLEHDHGGSQVFGPVQLDYRATDSLRFEHAPAESPSLLEAMPELFQDEFAAPFAARYAAEQAAEAAAEEDEEDEDYEPDVDLEDDLRNAVHEGFIPGNDTVLRPVPGWPAA